MTRHLAVAILAFLITLAFATSLSAETVEWQGGKGPWETAANWGGSLPTGATSAQINGTKEKPGEVTLALTNVLVSHLSVAERSSNVASLILDGPSLTIRGGIDVGKYDGSEGRFILKSGSFFANTIFVSGGGGPGMRGNGTVRIESGNLVVKDIELGVSAGCHSTFHIVGSKATAIFAEDGLRIGVYNYLSLEKEPPPSTTELIFDIDADGVTPIFTWGKTEGRINFPVPDEKRNGVGSCQLKINLLAGPPSGDILLVGSTKPCRGTFTGLAEGALVRSSFGNDSYEWTLTYRGGPRRSDIMLTKPRVSIAGAGMVAYTSGEKPKPFKFDSRIVESGYREFYRQSDALELPIGGGTLAFPGAEGC